MHHFLVNDAADPVGVLADSDVDRRVYLTEWPSPGRDSRYHPFPTVLYTGQGTTAVSLKHITMAVVVVVMVVVCCKMFLLLRWRDNQSIIPQLWSWRRRGRKRAKEATDDNSDTFHKTFRSYTDNANRC